MKKLFFLVSLLVLIGVSGSVMGQTSTGTSPFPGAKHTYKVDGGGSGSGYEWSVLKADLTSTTDGAITASSGDTNDKEVFVAWSSSLAAGTVYYVQVKKTVDNCTNTRLIKVTIALNNFSLAIATGPTGCYLNDVTPGKDIDGNPIYTHGAAKVIYTVTPTGLSAAQSYSFTITPPAIAGYTVSNPVVLSGNASGTTNISVNNNALVTLEYTITKTDPTTNADTNGTGANFTAQADINTGTSSLGTTGTSTGVKSASQLVSRPGISVIETSEN